LQASAQPILAAALRISLQNFFNPSSTGVQLVFNLSSTKFQLTTSSRQFHRRFTLSLLPVHAGFIPAFMAAFYPSRSCSGSFVAA